MKRISKKDFSKIQPCAENINSEYGDIPYEEWCRREIKRIKNPDFVIKYKNDKKTGIKYCCISQ